MDREKEESTTSDTPLEANSSQSTASLKTPIHRVPSPLDSEHPTKVLQMQQSNKCLQKSYKYLVSVVNLLQQVFISLSGAEAV